MNNKKNLAALDLFIVQFAHFSNVSKISKFEKNFSRSLSPEISELKHSLKVNLFFKSRIISAGSLFFSKI